MKNLDDETVRSFGNEWSTFDQSRLPDKETPHRLFHHHFAVFPWDRLPDEAVGADLGCGSGRWALRGATRVGTLHCIDAGGQALGVACHNLAGQQNCRFHHAGPLPPSPACRSGRNGW